MSAHQHTSPADDETTPTTLGRRRVLRAGVGAGAAGLLAQPAAAQASPYDGWFADTDNFDGTVDRTGQDTVTVTVGAGSTGIQFDPPAIAIDPGTTVIWEWSGQGGSHNVVAQNGSFESELVGEAGHTFEHTFGEGTDSEIIKYVCEPHQALGMVGAVAVGGAVTPVESSSGGASGASGTATGAGGTRGSGGDSGGLSAPGYLPTLAGVFGLALLSPVLFALGLKVAHMEDRQAERDEHFPGQH
ncbi:MAG: halocyanin domain-containing protein [Haloarculaceae archaeon]